MKRRKFDWLREIDECRLNSDFEQFCAENDLKQHLRHKKALSRKRLAYAYMVHIGSIIRNTNIWR